MAVLLYYILVKAQSFIQPHGVVVVVVVSLRLLLQDSNHGLRVYSVVCGFGDIICLPLLTHVRILLLNASGIHRIVSFLVVGMFVYVGCAHTIPVRVSMSLRLYVSIYLSTLCRVLGRGEHAGLLWNSDPTSNAASERERYVMAVKVGSCLDYRIKHPSSQTDYANEDSNQRASSHILLHPSRRQASTASDSDGQIDRTSDAFIGTRGGCTNITSVSNAAQLCPPANLPKKDLSSADPCSFDPAAAVFVEGGMTYEDLPARISLQLRAIMNGEVSIAAAQVIAQTTTDAATMMMPVAESVGGPVEQFVALVESCLAAPDLPHSIIRRIRQALIQEGVYECAPSASNT